MCPHLQGLSNNWCSVTIAFMGGISITCLLLAKKLGCPVKSSPQQLQYNGIWCSILSGFSICFKVVPSCPACPPGFLPEDCLRLWVFCCFGKSLDGDLLLLRLFLGFSYFSGCFSNLATSDFKYWFSALK